MTSAINGFNPVFIIQGFTCVMEERTQPEMYLEVALVKDLQLQASQPMTRDAIKEIRNAFDVELDGNDLVKKGWITEDIVYIDNQNRRTFFIYYEPAGMQNMVVNGSFITRPKPTLIFIVKEDKLFVFASIDNKKPDRNTVLYHCPFSNTTADESICLGDAKTEIDRTDFDLEINYWKAIYWKSEFTAEASPRLSKAFKLDEFRKAKVFKPEWLLTTNRTLNEIIGNG